MEKVSATRRGSEEAKKNPKKLLFLFHPVFTDDAVLYHMTLDIVCRGCFFFFSEDAEIRATLGPFFFRRIHNVPLCVQQITLQGVSLNTAVAAAGCC